MEFQDNALSPIARKACDSLARLIDSRAGYHHRPAQRRMCEIVADTLARTTPVRHSLVEAPAGTGKGVASLLASAMVAAQEARRVVVATSSQTVGERILLNDWEPVRAALGWGRAAIAKGRSRYLCPARLVRAMNEPVTAKNTKMSIEAGQFARLLADGWTGDRDHLDIPVTDSVWRLFTTENRACHRRHCEFFDSCPYYKAREKLRHADVLVTTHDLFVSDLDAGGGIFLPKPEQTLYILDDGHRLPDRARHGFARSVRIDRMLRILEHVPVDIAGPLRQVRDVETAILVRNTLAAARTLHAGLATLLTAFENHGPLQVSPESESGVTLLTAGHGASVLREHATILADQGETLDYTMFALFHRITHLRGQGVLDPEMAEDVLMATGRARARVREQTELWMRVQSEDWTKLQGHGWIEAGSDPDGSGYRVTNAPLQVHELLAARFFDRARASIITSPTLTRRGDFSAIRHDLGLSGRQDTHEEILAESLAASRATLEVMDPGGDPLDLDEHARSVGEAIPSLLDPTSGTLIVFASRRERDAVVATLPDQVLADLEVEGTHATHVLVERHRQRLASGRRSILAGTIAFAETVDLPGDLCRHIIITRIPFPAANDALLAARAEQLALKGKNPFIELVVTEATQRLIRAMARLLRREEDSGRITVLDPRLTHTGYGAAILQCLPHYATGNPAYAPSHAASTTERAKLEN